MVTFEHAFLSHNASVYLLCNATSLMLFVGRLYLSGMLLKIISTIFLLSMINPID